MPGRTCPCFYHFFLFFLPFCDTHERRFCNLYSIYPNSKQSTEPLIVLWREAHFYVFVEIHLSGMVGGGGGGKIPSAFNAFHTRYLISYRDRV